MQRARPALLSLALLCVLGASGCGGRGGGGGALLGAGETVSHRADLTPEGAAMVEQETGLANAAVGFKYEYFSVFFLDLWTGKGEVVFYDDTRYVVPSAEWLRAVTGMSADDFGKPFLYSVPLGWIVLLVIVAGGALYTWRGMRELG